MARKKRTEAFFGIHFDFHAAQGQIVPSVYRPESFETMLDAVNPDYVQCDTKGHPGISSYSTKVGNPPENCPHDVLKTIREITAKRDIPLFGHYSGLYDVLICAQHPDWAAVTPDGNRSANYLSVFSPYVDKLMIPQLKELAGVYKLDGAWVDGDCWGAQVDYSHWAIDAYKAEYGAEPPRPEDENYEDYRQFCRKGFENYVNRYMTEVLKEYPDFQITSNWIYSQNMAHKMDVQMPWLSGDLDSTDALYGGRVHGRVFEARNLPWDLMGWGHNFRYAPGLPAIACDDCTTKGKDQYLQEAASVVMLGGGYQFYNIQHGHGGTIQDWAIPLWEATAKFCRERIICHKGKLLPQVGVLLPDQPNPAESGSCYTLNTSGRSFRRWISLLQESGFSTSAVFEHEPDSFSRFSILVCPNSDAYPPKTIAALKNYVANGGRLIIDGGASEHLQALTGIVKISEEEERQIFLEGGGRLAAAKVPFKKFDLAGAEVASLCYDSNFFQAESNPSSYINNIGKGKICTLTFPMLSFYDVNRAVPLNDFIRDTMKRLEYVPYVSVAGSCFAEHTILTKDDSILVNLLNRAGEHQVPAIRCYDEVPSIGPLTVTIQDKSVKSVTQIPENVSLPMTPTEDGFQVTIDRLHIHTILKLDK